MEGRRRPQVAGTGVLDGEGVDADAVAGPPCVRPRRRPGRAAPTAPPMARSIAAPRRPQLRSARLAWIRRSTTSCRVHVRSRRPSAPARGSDELVLRRARAATDSSPSCQAAMKAALVVGGGVLPRQHGPSWVVCRPALPMCGLVLPLFGRFLTFPPWGKGLRPSHHCLDNRRPRPSSAPPFSSVMVGGDPT